jgi:hypothetical protein
MRRPVLTPILTLVALAACSPERTTNADPSAVIDAPSFGRSADYSAWSAPIRIDTDPSLAHPNFNTPFLDGCPLTSRDGKLFFIASTRPRAAGETGATPDIDIWVARRAKTDDPWGEPQRLPAPINSTFNDFCPMLARDGQTFYFVSNRPTADDAGTPACGGTDIYVSRMRQDGSFDSPRNLGCSVNSRWDEAGPVPVNEPTDGPALYFSSARRGGFSPDGGEADAPGDADLYRTIIRGNSYGAAELVPLVNSAQEDAQPYIREDARELFFYSNRPGSLGNDLWVASREHARDPWNPPTSTPLANVNSAAPETRPSLSTDGLTLYFGSTRPAPEGKGGSDVYRATRTRLRNN